MIKNIHIKNISQHIYKKYLHEKEEYIWRKREKVLYCMKNIQKVFLCYFLISRKNILFCDILQKSLQKKTIFLNIFPLLVIPISVYKNIFYFLFSLIFLCQPHALRENRQPQKQKQLPIRSQKNEHHEKQKKSQKNKEIFSQPKSDHELS